MIETAVDVLFTECTTRRGKIRQSLWSTKLMIRQLLFTLHVYWISVCLQWYTINDYILDAAWPTSSEVHRGSSLLHASTSLLFYAEVCTCNTVVLSELRGSSSPRLTNCLSLRLLLNVSSQHICIVLCSRVLLKCPLAFILRRSLLFFLWFMLAGLIWPDFIFYLVLHGGLAGFYYYKSTGAELNTTRVEKY